MKKLFTLFGVAIVSLLFANQGFSFLDDLLKPPPPKKSQDGGQTQKNNPASLTGWEEFLAPSKKMLIYSRKAWGWFKPFSLSGKKKKSPWGKPSRLKPSVGLVGNMRNASLTHYINLVGKTVAEVSDRPNLNFHFAILNSKEQNAFAAPGGYIFVTIGLLKTLKNEAELAGVLAHEVAHITQKHMLETIRRGALLANVSEFSMAAMNKNPEMFSNVIDEITDKLFTKGLDKDKEFEADVYGIEFAYRAGYNPKGLQDYLRTLRSQEGHAQSRFFTTHPSTSTRIKKIEAKLGEYTDGATFPILTKRFQQHMKSG